MKKIIAILTIALGIALSAAAQPRAIGLRGGYGAEFSYQHTLGQAGNFLEADLGMGMYMCGGGYHGTAFDLHASYNFILASPNWTAGEWNIYAGPSAGTIFGAAAVPAATDVVTVAVMTLGGQLGLEYTFPFNLQLSVDIHPDVLTIGKNANDNILGVNLLSFVPCFGVRYRF